MTAPHPPARAASLPSVLVVDDDQLVCSLVARTLTAAGYTVWTAGNAGQARRLLAQLDRRLDILLTDVAMPGGLGTLEELFEVWTWGQLGLHRKPYGLFDVNEFFAPLLGFLDHAVTEGFIRHEYRDLLVVDTQPAELIRRMEAMAPPALPRWLDRATT